jgi:hypothetical protein
VAFRICELARRVRSHHNLFAAFLVASAFPKISRKPNGVDPNREPEFPLSDFVLLSVVSPAQRDSPSIVRLLAFPDISLSVFR